MTTKYSFTTTCDLCEAPTFESEQIYAVGVSLQQPHVTPGGLDLCAECKPIYAETIENLRMLRGMAPKKAPEPPQYPAVGQPIQSAQDLYIEELKHKMAYERQRAQMQQLEGITPDVLFRPKNYAA